ncbi:MAG: hypothetical protein MOB07_16145 [Acidobacteria bacterium]|nr:hypothetical protein [Acidobacteriota bacterium]
MKRHIIRYSLIVLLIGLGALTAGRAYAQTQAPPPFDNGLSILGISWGYSTGQTARISIAFLADGSVRLTAPVIARMQLLDMEGEVIAQSDEIRIEPGKIRFWDAPRELLPAGEPNGRIQLRPRILVTGMPSDLNRIRRHLAPAMEVIDSGTGRTAYRNFNFRIIISTSEIADD